MYLIKFRQGEIERQIGAFLNLTSLNEFLQLIPGYELIPDSEDQRYDERVIHFNEWSDYMEIRFRELIYPLSRFSFPGTEDLDVEIEEIPVLDDAGKGMVDYYSVVDAYVIDSGEVKEYIETREDGYRKVSDILRDKGYEAARAYAGSEDGEAILYREKGNTDLHFLGHMDAGTVEEWKCLESPADWEQWVLEQLN